MCPSFFQSLTVVPANVLSCNVSRRDFVCQCLSCPAVLHFQRRIQGSSTLWLLEGLLLLENVTRTCYSNEPKISEFHVINASLRCHIGIDAQAPFATENGATLFQFNSGNSWAFYAFATHQAEHSGDAYAVGFVA